MNLNQLFQVSFNGTLLHGESLKQPVQLTLIETTSKSVEL